MSNESNYDETAQEEPGAEEIRQAQVLQDVLEKRWAVVVDKRDCCRDRYSDLAANYSQSTFSSGAATIQRQRCWQPPRSR